MIFRAETVVSAVFQQVGRFVLVTEMGLTDFSAGNKLPLTVKLPFTVNGNRFG